MASVKRIRDVMERKMDWLAGKEANSSECGGREYLKRPLRMSGIRNCSSPIRLGNFVLSRLLSRIICIICLFTTNDSLIFAAETRRHVPFADFGYIPVAGQYSGRVFRLS